jgi:hypothetical protein
MVLFSNLCNAPRVRQFALISLSPLTICEVPRLGLLFRTDAHTDLDASMVPGSTASRACRFRRRGITRDSSFYEMFVEDGRGSSPLGT